MSFLKIGQERTVCVGLNNSGLHTHTLWKIVTADLCSCPVIQLLVFECLQQICCTEIILLNVSVSNHLQQWTNFLHEFRSKSGVVGNGFTDDKTDDKTDDPTGCHF